MFVPIVCAIFIPPLLFLIYNYINQLIKLKEYPPGPIPLPIIGNLHQLGERPYKTFMKMKEKYGDVFSVSFGDERVVIINSIKPAREALITRLNSFSGRPRSYLLNIVSRDFISLLLSDVGPYYTYIKKLGHSAMRMFGEGNVRFHQIVTEESEYLHKRLKEHLGTPVDIHSEFGMTVINLVAQLLFNERYTENDEEYRILIQYTTLLVQGFSPSNLINFFPWLRHFPLDSLKKFKLGIKLRDQFFRRKLLEHRSTYNPNKLRDCLDVFIKATEEENTHHDFTDDNIEMLATSIFEGGTETTTTTLRWAVLYLLHWPQYQDEIYEEIKRKVGSNRYPDMNDRNNLDLTQAFIQEVLRYSSLTPFGLPRKTMANTEVAGYFISKETQVLFNVWSIHYDPKQWQDPEAFNPRRFLNEEEKYISGSQQSFLPFSAGRRSCFGETIAKLELFLIFSRLMRDFKFTVAFEEKLPSLDGVFGITLSPNQFSIECKLRHDHLVES